jgi:DNA-binding CsgD family transcriptional regulator
MATANPDRFERLFSQGVELCYDSLVEPHKLELALEAWRGCLSAQGSSWSAFDRTHQNVVGFASSGYDSDAQRLWVGYYNTLDPVRAPILTAPPGEWLWDDCFLDPVVARKSEYVHDFATRNGIRYLRGGKMYEDADQMAVLTFQKPEGQGFDEALTRHLLQRIQPHVASMARLRHDLARWQMDLCAPAAALDALACGVVVVNAAFHVRHLNHAAETWAGPRPGWSLRDGHLVPCSGPPGDRLRKALRLAFGKPRQASSFVLEGLAPTQGLHVRVLPLSEGAGRGLFREPLAMVCLESPGRAWDVGELRSRFGLTRAEAQVGALLAAGARAEECAAQCGVSITTIRTHLRNLFAKTGAQNQAQFVALVRSLPRMRGPQDGLRPPLVDSA